MPSKINPVLNCEPGTAVLSFAAHRDQRGGVLMGHSPLVGSPARLMPRAICGQTFSFEKRATTRKIELEGIPPIKGASRRLDAD